jgi:hypothetical protein
MTMKNHDSSMRMEDPRQGASVQIVADEAFSDKTDRAMALLDVARAQRHDTAGDVLGLFGTARSVMATLFHNIVRDHAHSWFHAWSKLSPIGVLPHRLKHRVRAAYDGWHAELQRLTD